MAGLLGVLTAIALLDSTSITPLCIVPLLTLLARPRPLAGAAAFLTGIFVSYTASGVLLIVGLAAVFAPLNQGIRRWLHAPTPIEVWAQIAVGLAMLAFTFKVADSRTDHGDRGTTGAVSPGAAFGIGAALTLVGMPGALPYFGAVDQILRADLSSWGGSMAILYYNVVFILPLSLVVIAKLWLGDRIEPLLRALERFLDRWGRRVVLAVGLILGALLVADGVGLLLGNPLLPVSPPPGG